MLCILTTTLTLFPFRQLGHSKVFEHLHEAEVAWHLSLLTIKIIQLGDKVITNNGGVKYNRNVELQ